VVNALSVKSSGFAVTQATRLSGEAKEGNQGRKTLDPGFRRDDVHVCRGAHFTDTSLLRKQDGARSAENARREAPKGAQRVTQCLGNRLQKLMKYPPLTGRFAPVM